MEAAYPNHRRKIVEAGVGTLAGQSPFRACFRSHEVTSGEVTYGASAIFSGQADSFLSIATVFCSMSSPVTY